MTDKETSKKSALESIKEKATELVQKVLPAIMPFINKRPKLSAAIGGVLLVLITFVLMSGGGEDDSLDYFKVQRGDFLVSLTEGGTLQAVNETVVRNEVPGNSRVVYIVPEGTYVKKGDLVVQLDAEPAEKNLQEVMIRYEDDKADALKAATDVTITKSSMESQIRKAQLSVQFARMDLQKFEEIEREQEIRNAQISIISAQESLKLAEERLEWSEKLTEEGFETKSNLDRDKLAVTNQSLNLEKARSSERMLSEYELEKLEAKYRSALQEAEEELKRTIQQAESRINQAVVQEQIERRKLQMSEVKLAQMEEYLENTEIHAPQSGLIVYAGSSNRYSNESIIEEGAMIRLRQAVVKIPDTSEMKVIVKVHESHVNQVKEGQRAFVVLDSMPDNRYAGKVSKIALLPDAQSRWGDSNLKVYSTEIVIEDQLPDIKPGASARAEIVITKLEDVLTVPIQCVTTVRGKQVCYIKSFGDPKPIEVEIGLFNNKFIEIKSGLDAGDLVLLSPPLETNIDLSGALIQQDEDVELPESQPEPEAVKLSMTTQRSAGADGEEQGMPKAVTGEQEGQKPDRAAREQAKQEAMERRAKARGGDGDAAGQRRSGGGGGGGGRSGSGGGGGGGGRG